MNQTGNAGGGSRKGKVDTLEIHRWWENQDDFLTDFTKRKLHAGSDFFLLFIVNLWYLQKGLAHKRCSTCKSVNEKMNKGERERERIKAFLFRVVN